MINNFFTPTKKEGVWIILLLLLGLAHLSVYFKFQPDDTFIYLVYIKNFISSNGLSFNGEYVEGFSSVLWVYLNALFAWLPVDYIHISKLISGIFYFLTPYLMFQIITKVIDNNISKINIFLVLTTYFFYPPLAIWAMGGLETMLYSFWLLLCLYYYFYIRTMNQNSAKKEFLTVGVLFGLLATIRPEAFALVGIVILYELYLLLKTKKIDYNFYTTFVMTYISFIFALLLWRYSLYGEFLPITAIAKTGDLHHQITVGLGYVKSFYSDWWPLIIAYVYAVVKLFFTKNTTLHSWNIISLITITGYTLFIIASGADWMLSYRFFVPIIPIAFVVIYLSILENRFMILVVLISIAFFTYKNTHIHKQIQQDIAATYGDVLIGQYLKNLHLDTNEYIAVVDAGAIPYYANNKTIDMVGLNNKHIAHLEGTFMLKHDNNFVLQHKPLYIQIHVQKVKEQITNMPDFIGSSKLYYSKEFHQNYIYDSNATVGGLFLRRDTVQRHTHMDTYYDYAIQNFELNDYKLHFTLHKTGADIWLKPQHPHAMCSIYANIKVKDQQNNIVYEELIPISQDMAQNDKIALESNLPKLGSNTYLVEIQPTQMGITHFDKLYTKSITIKE